MHVRFKRIAWDEEVRNLFLDFDALCTRSCEYLQTMNRKIGCFVRVNREALLVEGAAGKLQLIP